MIDYRDFAHNLISCEIDAWKQIFQPLISQHPKGHLTTFWACEATWLLVQRNSFQSWYLWEKSSIDLVMFVKIVMQILMNCLVTHERFKRHILCFEFNSVEKYDVFESGFSKRLEFESSTSCRHVSKENNKEMGWRTIMMWERTSETSYNCRRARKLQESKPSVVVFTQDRRDKYSLQINVQKPVDKEILERHVRLQADPRRIHGACNGTTISFT